jgi:hypothetical protein
MSTLNNFEFWVSEGLNFFPLSNQDAYLSYSIEQTINTYFHITFKSWVMGEVQIFTKKIDNLNVR